MEKRTPGDGKQFPLFHIDLKVKLTTLLLLVCMVNLKAAGTYAQNTKVSLDLTKASVGQVLETIQQTTDFRFVYNTNDVDLSRVVTIRVRKKTIDVVLEMLFQGTPTAYKIQDTQIILKKEDDKRQGILIKGKVVDEKGEPLPGASILEEGTMNAALADLDGNFAITVSSENSYLVVSFVGYGSFRYQAKENNKTVQLSPEANALSEVVVIGYGSTSRRDVTGAVSSVVEKDMNQGAITTPLQLITGKLAGVAVTQIGNEPGSAPSIRIRGFSSLIGGSDPLVVVDGIQGNLDLLNQIPPGEIASFDILKDASATAIYGSRGAPGVIIVTTKRNKAGKTTVEYTSSFSYDMIPKKLDMLSADEWWAQAQLNGVPASANHGSNTDWFNILTRNGYTQNHSLSFGGGTDKFSYRASITAILQNGIVIESEARKYIGRLQAQQTALNDKLKLTFSLYSGVDNTNRMVQSIGRASFTSNLITNAYLMRPTDPVFNTDGTYFTDPNVFQYLNPYAVTQTVTNEGKYDNLFGSLRADLELLPGLTAGWFGSWRKTNLMVGFFLPVESTSANAIDQNGFANIDNKREDERLMNMSLTYKKEFGSHSLNLLGLYEWQNQTYQGSYLQARGFINDATTYNAMQNGDISNVLPGDIRSYKNDRTLVSFLGRINYAFMERYLVTASLRRDGSSVFGPNHKWGNFPSASVAWQIDKEGFMQNQKIFDQLKIRGGYGETGNQQGLLPQNSISLVGANGVTYFGGQQITNYSITQNANRDLRWETKKQTNIGLEFSALNSRLRGSVDAYKSKTEDLLFNYTVPQPPFPFGSIMANVGSLENKGLEVALGYDLIKSEDMSLTLNGNFTTMKNKVLNLSGSINGVPLNTNYVPWGPNAYLIEGEPIGAFNILHHTGVDNANVETVEDVNGDGIIDQGVTSLDRKRKGQSLPTYSYAFNPVFRYKSFDFSMLWRGSGGNKIYNSLRENLSYQENIGRSNVLQSSVNMNIYTSPYDSDLWLEDGSFLRWENATAGYTFGFGDSKYLDNIRISITGTNILLITDYSGIDPEIILNGSADSGRDNGFYPRTRSIVFGLNVKFK